jgi:hypothetical protein
MSEKAILHLFYRDSDLKEGHGHRYVSKETHLPIEVSECRWVPSSNLFTFYFGRSGAESGWSVDGWACKGDENGAFRRYRDDRRGGWHVALKETRFVPIYGLKAGDRSIALSTKKGADYWARSYNNEAYEYDIFPTRQNDFDGWAILDLLGFKNPSVASDTQPTFAEELISAYTLLQREVGTALIVRGKRLGQDGMEAARSAWSAQLAAKVKASDAARREADRMMVVCQGDWLDDLEA